MPRKSQRMATTTYHRQQLTWNDTESSNLNCSHTMLYKTSDLVKTTSENLVTPSPRVVSASGAVGNNESLRKLSPRRKQLFTERKSSVRKPLTTTTTYGRTVLSDETSATSSPRRLFPSLRSNSFGETSAAIQDDSNKRSIPKRYSLPLSTTDVTSEKISGRRRRRSLISCDSLANFLSYKKAPSSSKNTTGCIINDRNDRRNRSQQHSIGTRTAVEHLNEKNKRFQSRQKISQDTTKISQGGDVEVIEKNSTSYIDQDNKIQSKRNRKSIPAELITLLVSRASNGVKITRSRSANQILDEFNKKRKELKKRQATRVCLPRACKIAQKLGFRESVTDEDTDEPEEDKSVDYDDDQSANISILQMNNHNPSRDEESTEEFTAADCSSTDETSSGIYVSPFSSTLKPKPMMPVSSSNGAQSLMLSDPPSAADNSEYEVMGHVSRKRRNSKRRIEDSFQHEEVDVSLQKINRRKQNFATSTNIFIATNTNPTAESLIENSRQKTSQLHSQDEVFIQSKQKRKRHRKGIKDYLGTTTSDISLSNTLNYKSLPLQDPTQSLTRSNEPSCRRLAKCKNQFSLIKYSSDSSHTNNEKSVHLLGAGIVNPSQGLISAKDCSTGVVPASSENPNNLSILRRGKQRLKPQASSNSTTEHASDNNEESRIRESSTRAKQHLGALLAKKSEQQQIVPRKNDEEVVSSGKKVRFHSSTTTFSVKIKIKTNLDTNRQKENRSAYGQSVSLPPSLNESAVHAIANQVTQAYLTHARTNIGTGSGGNIPARIDSGLDVNVDEVGDSSSNLSESSSNSNQNSDAEEESMGQKRSIEFLHNMSIDEAGEENCCLSLKNIDDWRSVTSELTSDWNKPRHSRSDGHEHFEREGRENVARLSKEHSVYNGSMWKDKDVEKSHSMKSIHHHDDPSLSNAMSLSRKILETYKCGKSRSHSSVCRRQRIRGCGDSLASSRFESIASVTELDTSSKVPRERNLLQSPTRSTRRSSSRRQFDTSKNVSADFCVDDNFNEGKKPLASSCFESIASVTELDTSSKVPRELNLLQSPTRSTRRSPSRRQFDIPKNVSADFCVDDNFNEGKKPARGEERELENTQATPIAPRVSRKSRLIPFSPNYRCGKCKKCQRAFDCQTCEICLKKLHFYGSPSMQEGLGTCLLRRCQRTSRVGSVDSLLDVRPSLDPLQSNHPTEEKEEQIHVLSQGKTSSLGNTIEDSMDAKNKFARDSQVAVTKSKKRPWEDGDDWTVDYSYLSEPEYRRHWDSISHSTSTKRKLLSTKRLSTPSWWLPVNEKQTITGFGGGGRTNLSSVSESVVSQKVSKMINSVSISDKNREKVKRRDGKRKRNPLHGLALPSTYSDACSVTSWRANRKCLLALMNYDEADQDWV